MESPDSSTRFCTDCDQITSGSVKHCKLCERCVVHMDHHCLFLLTCVATLNHLKFVVFIIAVEAEIVLFLISSYRFLSFHINQIGIAWVDLAFEKHMLMSSVMVLNFGSLLWGWSLIYWNIKYISSGLTYYESLLSDSNSTKSTLSLSDRYYNILRFFQGHKTPYKTPGVHCI